MDKLQTKRESKKRFRLNLFDVFLILLVLLVFTSAYFTLIHPIRFSQLIQREDVLYYGRVEILLPDDLFWMKDVLSPGQENKDVYGRIDWKIAGIDEIEMAGRKWLKLTVDLQVYRKDSGILRYGKYTLAKGSKIFLINDDFVIEGRVFDFELNQKVPY